LDSEAGAVTAWTFAAFWNLATGLFSVSILIGCGALAIAIFTPPLIARFVPNLRTTALLVAAGAFSFSAVAGKYYHDGLAAKQAEWDRALVRETDHGEIAREKADSLIVRDTPDVVRNDPANRDNWTGPAERDGVQ
jgi:hypothetical protein